MVVKCEKGAPGVESWRFVVAVAAFYPLPAALTIIFVAKTCGSTLCFFVARWILSEQRKAEVGPSPLRVPREPMAYLIRETPYLYGGDAEIQMAYLKGFLGPTLCVSGA